MKVNNLFLASCLSVLSLVSFGQDHHFSQFYATPLSTNPANTGNFVEDWRFSAIHRNQWSGIGSAFITSAVGFDMNFSGGFIGQDKMGVGVVFLKDEVGQSGLSNNTFLLSSAWHRRVDHQKRHKISLGVQGGLIQKSLNGNGLQFGNQYQNYEFNPNLSNEENLSRLNQSYIDIEAGLGWHFLLSSNIELESGIAVYQLTSPQENFTETVDSLFKSNDLGNRLSYTAGAIFKVGHGITIHPRVLFMGQSKARDINAGASLGYPVGKKQNVTLLAGIYTRFGDAAIFKAGFKYKNVTTRLSYDATYSSLTEVKGAVGAGNTLGAWELSIIVVGRFRKDDQNYTVPCGIF